MGSTLTTSPRITASSAPRTPFLHQAELVSVAAGATQITTFGRWKAAPGFACYALTISSHGLAQPGLSSAFASPTRTWLMGFANPVRTSLLTLASDACAMMDIWMALTRRRKSKRVSNALPIRFSETVCAFRATTFRRLMKQVETSQSVFATRGIQLRSGARTRSALRVRSARWASTSQRLQTPNARTVLSIRQRTGQGLPIWTNASAPLGLGDQQTKQGTVSAASAQQTSSRSLASALHASLIQFQAKEQLSATVWSAILGQTAIHARWGLTSQRWAQTLVRLAPRVLLQTRVRASASARKGTMVSSWIVSRVSGERIRNLTVMMTALIARCT